MIGKDLAIHLAKQALEHSSADQTEVLIMGDDSALTRFGNSYIHQNVAESGVELRVRVALGKKLGVCATNQMDAEAVRRTVDEASRIARLQPENPDFVSLPGPEEVPLARSFAESTADYTPEQRADAAGVICRRALDSGLQAAGAFSTGTFELLVANSLGVEAYVASTLADLSTVVMSADSSGYSARAAVDVAEIDPDEIAGEAVEKALRGRGPTDLEPGTYEVVLEESAVLDMVGFLGYLGFGARALQEGTSFLAGKMDEQVLGDNITIVDDGLDPRGAPTPFDFEGVPKRRVNLIERGVARAVVYDSYTAGKDGRRSTGHALPAPNTFGPLPLNMFMREGTATRDDLIRSTRRGLLVTRFWYTEPVHPRLVVVTGMTRDGTFLIEDGRVTRPVRNLRFTHSYLEALSQVEALTSETRLLHGMLGVARVPAVKVSAFTFTGVTRF